MTQPRLCQNASKCTCDMRNDTLRPCEWFLTSHFCQMSTFDTTAVVSTCEVMRLWGMKNNPGDLWRLFITSLLQNNHFWHNRGCVKWRDNEIVISEKWSWGSVQVIWHTTFANWPLVTQPRLCHFEWKSCCGMWGMSLRTCRRDL